MGKIVLSDEQKRAIKHENTNSKVAMIAGLTYFVADDSNNAFVTKVLMAVGVGATFGFFSSLLFPVRIQDVLTFKDEPEK
jgi:hypothetical protein